MTDILGISAFYHDSAACLVRDGMILAAVQEERFTRKKQDAGFPGHAIRYCLQEANCALTDLRYMVFYDKPLVKFERLLETYHALAPGGVRSFVAAMPVWIKEKVFMRRLLADHLRELGDAKVPLYYPEHHLSHAASAFYPSPFEDAAILTVDGVGVFPFPLPDGGGVVHGRGRRMGHDVCLVRAGQPTHAAMGHPLSAFAWPPVLGVYLLHGL